MTAFRLTEVKADLFHVPQTYSLAYSCNASFTAEKGKLAWKFGVIFGQHDDLSRQCIRSGNVAVLEDNGRFIYSLITKDSTGDKSSYEILESALICLRHHMRNYSANKVAMPRICCGGHDELKWPRVKEIILRVFANDYNTEIMICNYHPPKIEEPKCRIIEQRGHNVEATKNCAVVHSISADFAMCHGIGMQFNCKYGPTNEMLKQYKHIGDVAVMREKKRFVYNLVTKERSHERCTYIALFYALTATRDHMQQHGVKKLAIPRLGCGIDRLDWLRVKNILEMVFAADDVEITTYPHDPILSVPSREKLDVHCATCKRVF